jgi:hypothetical protein
VTPSPPHTLTATPTLAIRPCIRDKLTQPQPLGPSWLWLELRQRLVSVGEARSIYLGRCSSSDVCLLRSIAILSGSLGAGGQNRVDRVRAEVPRKFCRVGKRLAV